MISEPELIGEPDEGPPPETLVAGGGPSRVDALARLTQRLRERGKGLPRRWGRLPWAWALAGATLASALWAGALYAYGDPGPDQRGYRIGVESCAKVPLRGLGPRLGGRDRSVDVPTLFEDPALNRLECVVGTGEPVPQGTHMQADFTVTLLAEQHRRTDPAGEFEARVRGGRDGEEPETVTPVEGIGDRAYLLRMTGIFKELRLVVLDGGVVLTLQVGGILESRGDGPPGAEPGETPRELDLTGVPGLMERDMRELMRALKG